MANRSVTYVLQRALREVKQETDFKKAKKENYQTAFDYLIDMLDDLRSRGFEIYSGDPESMNDFFGSQDPIESIVRVLTSRIAEYFNYELTVRQAAKASNAMRLLRNQGCTTAKMCRPSRMPRGSGNYYWTSYLGEDSNQLVNQQGVPIVTGVTS